MRNERQAKTWPSLFFLQKRATSPRKLKQSNLNCFQNKRICQGTTGTKPKKQNTWIHCTIPILCVTSLGNFEHTRIAFLWTKLYITIFAFSEIIVTYVRTEKIIRKLLSPSDQISGGGGDLYHEVKLVSIRY